MALPKGKISKARKHSRRANWKLTLPAIVDCPQCHKKMLIVSGEKGEYFRCKYDGTTEKLGGRKGKKKMSKHEERRLLKKINQDDEPQESALAAALKKAMEEK